MTSSSSTDQHWGGVALRATATGQVAGRTQAADVEPGLDAAALNRLPIVDAAAFARFAGGRAPQRLARIMTLLSAELGARGCEVPLLVAGHDRQGLAALAHSVAGASSAVGAARAWAWSTSIERSCRCSDPMDWEAVEAYGHLLGETRSELDRLEADRARVPGSP